jgi:hypothetical protein
MNLLMTRLRSLIWSLVAFSCVLIQWFTFDRGTTTEEILTSLSNFLSYFTIEVNCMLGVWYLLRGLHPRHDWGGGNPAVRLSLSTYGLVTIIVYWLLLSSTEHPEGIRFYANLGLHLVVPLAITVEWWFDRPVQRATWGSWAWALAVPVIYCGYSLIRGSITGWFPYFFVDYPKQGVGLTVAYIAGLFSFFLLLAAGLGVVWNRLAQPSSQATPT